ncbi:hypothetical protein HYV82_01125 [Candidatus Woesearchaeota archaeon]|nr:hypothetical protein [Candidatus Woesearchaeota archaeon]
MMKSLTIVFLVVLAVFISGCSGSPGKGGDKDVSAKLPFTYAAVHSGTEGVKVEFLPNAPPAELLAPFKSGGSYPFKAALKLSNKGAFDVEDGWVVLTSEEDYMKLDSFKTAFSLKGKSIFNPGGDSGIEVFDGSTKPFREGQSEKHKSIVLATLCYKYRTDVKTDVCIDTDVLGLSQKKKVCSVKDASLSGGQGAPLAVTKIEAKIFPEGSGERIAFVKPQYVIYIKNTGDGEVLNPSADMSSACSSELVSNRDSEAFKRIWNIATVSASLSGKELVCSPNPIRLRSKEDFVRCSLKDEDKIDASIPSYTSPLTITFNYGYTTTISKEVTVTREVGY